VEWIEDSVYRVWLVFVKIPLNLKNFLQNGMSDAAHIFCVGFVSAVSEAGGRLMGFIHF
jgi:hypothetical protein